MATATYTQLRGSLQTGDVILFEGSLFDDFMIGLLETAKGLSPFSHTGLVFRFPNSKPTDPPLIWQAVPAPHAEEYGNDYIKQTTCDGCQLVSLDTVISWCAVPNQQNENCKFSFAARHLAPALPAAAVAAMETFIRGTAGRSFSYPEDGMAKDYFVGAVEGKNSGNSAFFCSKLATATYQACGLIAPTVIPNAILPGNFAGGTTLNILGGYSLGDLIPFTAS